jgi:hypothetical protein
MSLTEGEHHSSEDPVDEKSSMPAQTKPDEPTSLESLPDSPRAWVVAIGASFLIFSALG